RDPLVGRDILIGFASGGLGLALISGGFVALRWIGKPPQLMTNPANYDLGKLHFITRFVNQINASLFLGLILLFLLLLLFFALRRERLALIILGFLWMVPSFLINQASFVLLPVFALASALLVFVLARYG